MSVRDQRLVLENYVCELLLLDLELGQKLFNVVLVRFQWLEFVTNIVAGLGVLILFRDVKRIDRGKVVNFQIWLRSIFLLRSVIRKSLALLTPHIAQDSLWVDELRILKILFYCVLELCKTRLFINLPLFPCHHIIILAIDFLNVVLAFVDT